MKLGLALLSAVAALELKSATPTKAEVASALETADAAVLKLKSDIESEKAKQEVQDAAAPAEEEMDEEMSPASAFEEDEIENPFEVYAADEDGPESADAQIEEEADQPIDEAAMDAEYDEEMEDTPMEELQAMMVAQNVTQLSHLKSFMTGVRRVRGGSCRGGCCRGNGDDCTSRATCPRGYVAIKCDMQGNGDGTYISYRGRHCYARGSWRSKRNTRAVATCISRRKWKHVIRRNSRTVRGRGWAVARCPRGWKVKGCTCHSYWMKCGRHAGGALRPNYRRNECKTLIHGRNRRTWARVYANCAKVNRSQRKPRRRRASNRKKPHPRNTRKKYLRKRFLKRLRRFRKARRSAGAKGKKGGKNPLDEMERTLNRVDRSLRSMERQLKSIQRHR